MSLREKLISDAIATAPWVGSCEDISTKALAFIVYHGGGNEKVIKASECKQALKELGTSGVLSAIATQYMEAD